MVKNGIIAALLIALSITKSFAYVGVSPMDEYNYFGGKWSSFLDYTLHDKEIQYFDYLGSVNNGYEEVISSDESYPQKISIQNWYRDEDGNCHSEVLKIWMDDTNGNWHHQIIKKY